MITNIRVLVLGSPKHQEEAGLHQEEAGQHYGSTVLGVLSAVYADSNSRSTWKPSSHALFLLLG